MKFKSIFVILICAFFSVLAHSQETKKIRIANSGFVKSDSTDVTVFVRSNQQQIHVIHNGIDMWCDKALYHESEDFLEAFSNVRMKQGDTISMKSDYLEYSGITQLAFASGNVVLKEPQSTLTTDTLHFDRKKQEAYYDTGGKVVRDTSGTITSRIGRYYMNSKKYQFVNNVVLVNPEYTLKTNHLDFYSTSGHAYLYGPSTITGETSNIYCEKGYYDTKNNVGYFLKRSKIEYDNRVVEGDSMYFDRARNFASATNNIKVTDTLNNSIVKGHYAEVYKAKDSVFIKDRAVAITVQENDSIYIHGDRLLVTGKPENRITRAYYNVKIFKSDLSGKADSIHMNHKTGLTQLINLARFSSTDAFATARKPALWNLGNQMTGDSIHIISNPKTEQIDSLKVFDNAFIINKDTIGEGYNQIKGQKLYALFENNEINKIHILKNAEVHYYTRNEKNELIGINKSKSGRIEIKMLANTIDEIRLINQIDGKLHPEEMLPENARILRGFDWREEERPKSVEDLFKDDPPLKLKVIKGLDDYVPQKEFFDEDLRSRIDKADKHPDDEQKENKAARQLPEKFKTGKTFKKKKQLQKVEKASN